MRTCNCQQAGPSVVRVVDINMDMDVIVHVELTVEVISEEQTSHTYLTPPSVPREAVFFLIRPMPTRVASGL